MMRGQAFRYSGWMIWDRHAGRLLGCLVMAAAIMLPIYFGTRRHPIPPERAADLLGQLHTQFAFIFALLFGNGLIGTDRIQGFFRFYLAKPVSPLWFYAQHTVFAIIGTLLASAGFVTIFAVLIAPAWEFHLVWRALALCLLMVVPIIMFSALSRHDWLWAIALWLLTVVLRGRFPVDTHPAGGVVNAVLPPYHLMNKPGLTAAEWTWLGGWALAFFAGTMLILWRRPLAED